MRALTLLFHDVFVRAPHESGFSSQAAHRYKLPLAAFEAQLAGVAAVQSPWPLTLTFDDGGVSYYTLAADRLERHGWRGHCFVSTDMIGDRAFLTPAQMRELDARGHVIGSHSASHPRRFSALTAARMRDEWSRSRRVLEDILGHEVDVASVPGGYFSKAVALAARDAGIRVLFNSEPVTSIDAIGGCRVHGRYTIRGGDAPHMARAFVSSPWARSRAWIDWNAKGLVKPVLGPAYIRFTDWLAAH